MVILTVLKTLTARQSQIFDFVKEYLSSTESPPTLDEIRMAFGLNSVHGVREHLRALERKGVLKLTPGVSRGIRLVGGSRVDAEEFPLLPIIGRVAAGNPILAEAHVEAQCRVDPRLFRQRANYLLRVVGASMQDVGILDGDLLAIHQTQEARDGQIVIARVDNEVTVKRYKRSGHTAYLQPENRAFKTIEIDLRRESLAIEGVVVGVVRTL